MSTTAITVAPKQATRTIQIGLEPQTIDELQQLCALLAASGYFKDASQVPQACVKVLAGREMGIPPIAAMAGIAIIDGKPATGANILAACMKRAGYTWTIEQRDAKGVRMTIFFRGEKLGPSEFLEEDAKRAGLLTKQNWMKWPRSMYFARCISDAARTYAPEVFAGIPTYTAEELGAENTTEDGAPIAGIDTGGHPVGTQAAADAVAQRKLAELKAEKERAEADKPKTPPDSPFDFKRMLDHFASKKELLGEDVYYGILQQHGVKHANEFKSRSKAAQAFKAMGEYEKFMRAEKPEMPPAQGSLVDMPEGEVPYAD